MVKKTALTEYNVAKSCYQSIALKEGDEVVSISLSEPTSETMVLVTKNGYVLNAKIDDVTTSGRVTQGIKAINLDDNDNVVFATLSSNEGEIITVTNKAYAKRTILPEIDILARNRKGVKISPLGKENGTQIVFASLVKQPYTILIQDMGGIFVSKFTEDIEIASSRQSLGKSVTRSKAGLMVSGVYIFNKI